MIQAEAIPNTDHGGNGTGGGGGTSSSPEDPGNPASPEGKKVEGTPEKRAEIVLIHYDQKWGYSLSELVVRTVAPLIVALVIAARCPYPLRGSRP